MVLESIVEQTLSNSGSNAIGAVVVTPYLHFVTVCSYPWIKTPFLFK